MRFEVLGPLVVHDQNGDPVSVRSTKLRVLLSVLLCTPNRVVSVDRLVAAGWGTGWGTGDSERSESARNYLQVYVYRLRRALGDSSQGSRLAYQAPGYVLTVRPDELDAMRFEQLLAEAQTARTDGDLERAIDRYDQALALWRGDPYPGLEDVEPLGTEAARLSELRLVALEESSEVALELGQHTALIPRLTELVDRHPLRERLRGLLMSALHRSGRTPEALATYREGRRRLVDEFGLEPGQELRDLETAILRDNPRSGMFSTETPGVGGPRSARAQRSTLPAAADQFVGRTDDVARIAKLLARTEDAVAVVAIDGGAGVGKSTVALQVAHQVAEHFPDGVRYVDFGGPEPQSVIAVLTDLLVSYGFDPAEIPNGLDEAAARFRSVVAGRRMLLVLDGVADTAQVRPLLPGTPTAAVLLTSRRVLSTLDGVAHVHLAAFSEAESLELLARLAGPRRVSAEPAAAVDLVRLCDHLPLAVHIVGLRIAAASSGAADSGTSGSSGSLRWWADRLADEGGRLDELRLGDLSVRASFAAGLDGLEPFVRRLFRLLGTLDDDSIRSAAVATRFELPAAQVRDALDVLVDHRLLWAIGPDHYRLSALIRLFARHP